MEKVYTQIYRQTQLGQSLEEALGDLDAEIDPSLKRKVLGHFDKVVHDTLTKNTQNLEQKRGAQFHARFKADSSVSEDSKLESYRFCEQTWTLMRPCASTTPSSRPTILGENLQVTFRWHSSALQY